MDKQANRTANVYTIIQYCTYIYIPLPITIKGRGMVKWSIIYAFMKGISVKKEGLTELESRLFKHGMDAAIQFVDTFLKNRWHWGVTDASCSLCCICPFFYHAQDWKYKLQQCSEVQWAEIIKVLGVKHMRHVQNDRPVALQETSGSRANAMMRDSLD